MKVDVRKIGNSLGVILPRPVLESWGVGEGDQLEVTDKVEIDLRGSEEQRRRQQQQRRNRAESFH